MVALAMAGPAFGQKMETLPSKYLGPYRGKLIEHHVASAWGPCGRGNEGCAFRNKPKKGMCTIYYTDLQIRAHEIAHCNGWPSDHPLSSNDYFHWAPQPNAPMGLSRGGW